MGTPTPRAARIFYTNWRGEKGFRNIVPRRIWWGSNQWHTEPQWLLDAHDVAKDAERTFAMKDIHEWSRVGERDHAGIHPAGPDQALRKAVQAFLNEEGAVLVHPGTDEDTVRLDVPTHLWEDLVANADLMEAL